MAQAERQEVVDIPMKDFYQVIEDFAAYPQFVTGMKDAKILEEKPDRKKIFFDMEMVKRLQYSVWATGKFDEAKGVAELSWELADSSFFKKNNGRWRLKALGVQKTEVTYSLDVEFSFSVPGFILKGLISNSLPLAIKEFAKRAQMKKAGA